MLPSYVSADAIKDKKGNNCAMRVILYLNVVIKNTTQHFACLFLLSIKCYFELKLCALPGYTKNSVMEDWMQKCRIDFKWDEKPF